MRASLISINEKPILKGSINCSNFNARIQSRIDNVIQDSEFIDSFNITLGGNGLATEDVMNELIGRILMQEIHPKGFKNIALNTFGICEDRLNEELLDRVAAQS